MVANSTSVLPARPLKIGFVSHNHLSVSRALLRQAPDRFSPELSRIGLVSYAWLQPVGFVCVQPARAGSMRQAAGGTVPLQLWLQSAIRNPQFNPPRPHVSSFRLSNRKSSIINHKSEGVPLPMGGVAGTMPEFCARKDLKIAQTLVRKGIRNSSRRSVLPSQLLHQSCRPFGTQERDCLYHRWPRRRRSRWMYCV